MSEKQPSHPRIDWRAADLRGVNMAGVCLDHADMRAADLRGVNFAGCDLRYADLRGAHLEGATFQNANLYGAKLQGAEAFRVDFRGADLRQANLAGAYLEGAMMPPLTAAKPSQPTPGELAKQKPATAAQQGNGHDRNGDRAKEGSRGR